MSVMPLHIPLSPPIKVIASGVRLYAKDGIALLRRGELVKETEQVRREHCIVVPGDHVTGSAHFDILSSGNELLHLANPLRCNDVGVRTAEQ
jgi:hypothetical protein